jgi:medium-chain acyl-[acyl-carrier-protein] hydrolase
VTLDRWFPARREGAAVRCRLFCFPHAGGNALFFRPWQRLMPSDIDVCPVELPGRGARIPEQPFRRMDQLVESLCDIFDPLLTVPFAFFGHSMGAYIAFELARRLRSANGPAALHLFVSGAGAPNRPGRRPAMHAMPDHHLVAALGEFGGTPPAVMARQELVAALLPTMRADLELVETYRAPRASRVPCPITAFGGAEDTIGRRSLEMWSGFTEESFGLRIFPGGHFYLSKASTILADEIVRTLGASAQVTRSQATG